MIVLFTDFGPGGPYTGQMKAVLAREAPGTPVVDLADDLPACDPEPAAYLLAAFAPAFPPGAVFVCVVDPGVGSERAPVALKAGGRWYVGPDNGLLAIVARRNGDARWFTIDWRPPVLSASFHGRDLFAPVAAKLARGEAVPGTPLDGAATAGADWPEDRAAIVYIDPYGNAMTGIRADRLAEDTVVVVDARRLGRLRTFSDAAPGAAFWYENANGLVEIAVNRGRADRALGLGVGTPVSIEPAAAPGDGLAAERGPDSRGRACRRGPLALRPAGLSTSARPTCAGRASRAASCARSISGPPISPAPTSPARTCGLRRSRGAKLQGARLAGADLWSADLKVADLGGAVLSECNLAQAELAGAKCRGADFSGAELYIADLRLADLENANLGRADGRLAKLEEAVLIGANLREANFSGASFKRARLATADLAGANLREANFREADLIRADFRGAEVADAFFGQANLDGTVMPDGTIESAALRHWAPPLEDEAG